jgi:hypothetical protein
MRAGGAASHGFYCVMGNDLLGGDPSLAQVVGAEGVALVDWAGSRKAYAGTYQIEFFNGFKSPVATETLVVAETTVLSTVPAPPSRQQ